MNIIFDQIQIALFPNNLKIHNPYELETALKKQNLAGKENSTINPIPPELPDDLTRLATIFNKGDQDDVRLNISQDKLLISINKAKKITLDCKVQFITDIATEINSFFTQSPYNIKNYKRIGLITSIYTVNEKPNQLIKASLLNNTPAFKNLTGSNLRLTFDTKLNVDKSIRYNEHVTIGDGTENETGKPVVLIKYDLNTHQTEDISSWPFNKILDFIKQGHNKSNKHKIAKRFLGKL